MQKRVQKQIKSVGDCRTLDQLFELLLRKMDQMIAELRALNAINCYYREKVEEILKRMRI